jgi:hypothetical protein
VSDVLDKRQGRPKAARYCGAKTRAGGTCKQLAMTNGRCRYHGGLSTGPKDTTNSSRNALKHGIYATRFTDEELALSQELKLGNVDEELRLMRLRLRRALEAEHQANGEPELDEVIERDISSDIGARSEEKKRVRDYNGIVDRIVGRIESLEMKRMELLKHEEGGEADKEPIGKIVVEVVSARASPDLQEKSQQNL